MDNSFKTLIAPAKSILILLPKNPDFDSVAAGTSLYLSLKGEETKEVNIFCPSPMIVEFNKLVAVNKIKQEIGNKNLAITFHDYNPQGIEKVSWDIDNGQFKLTVVPKVNVVPPNQDQVIVSYSGVQADLAILIGGKTESDFDILKSEDLKNVNLAHIGVSELNIPGKTIASLATRASSISEVTANIIKNYGTKIESDLATNLLMGIEESTNSFRSNAITADTFSLVADLLRSGGKRLNELSAAPAFQGPMPTIPTNIPSSWTEPKIFKGTSLS